MELQDIINVISTAGFPIAFCFYQAFTNNAVLKQLQKAVEDLSIAIMANTEISKLLEQHIFTQNNNNKGE